MKILGSDYDGTLNHNGIDAAKRDALQRWRDKGNVFALISGRGQHDILRLYSEQKFPCDYLIACNGAIIMTTDGEVISDIRCDGEPAADLLRLLFEKGSTCGYVLSAAPCCVCADALDCKEEDDCTLENMPEILYFNQLSTRLPDFETASYVTECIRERFADKLNPLQNGICIDVVRADMNKARGLYLLAEHLGAKYDDIIAVGDNINDIDMIKEFRSYAMENGVACVKELANYVTPSVTELIEKELAE